MGQRGQEGDDTGTATASRQDTESSGEEAAGGVRIYLLLLLYTIIQTA